MSRTQPTDASFRSSGSRLHPVSGALFHFLRCEIFLACSDRPLVAEWIDKRSASISPELISHRAHVPVYPSARADGAIEQRVAVFDVQIKRGRRSAERPRAFPLHHVVHHDAGVADLDFRVKDSSFVVFEA